MLGLIQKFKISIVIPVFNVEKYVEKCLRSCAEQDLPPEDYEIIVINDGTHDASLNVVERVACEYSNISVFSQENAGLSAARNKGLSIAKGKYIWFVDADDWIAKDCLKTIWNATNDCDVIAMGLVRTFEGESKTEVQNYTKFGIKNGQDLLKDKFFSQVPTFIYNKEFLLKFNLSFYEGIYHEDVEFTPRLLYFAKKIRVFKKNFYYVCKRSGSITTSSNSKKAFDNIRVAKSLSEFSKNIERVFHPRFHNRISLCINNALFNTLQMDKEEKKKLGCFIYEHRSLFKHLKRSTVLKYKLEGVLFSIFSKNTVTIYQIIQKFNRN